MTKKRDKGAPPKNRPAAPLTPGYQFNDRIPPWPGEFIDLRRALFIGAIWCCLAVFLAVAVQANSLLWLKRLVLFASGAADPAFLFRGVTSLDIGLMIGFLGAIAASTFVHPALGIATMLLVRPWLDGYTYPSDNLYFMWAIWFIFAVWSLRQILRNRPLHFPLPALLLMAFLLVAYLTALDSAEWSRSHKALLLWFSYTVLFLVTVNVARTPLGWRIVAGAIVLSLVLESLYAWPHYRFVLPYMRFGLKNNPQMLMEFFNTAEFTPELARRLNLNRAFGTLLFPNAYGAFLILGIPLTGVAAWRSLQRLRAMHQALRARAKLGVLPGRFHDSAALLFGGLVWLAISALVFAEGMLYVSTRIAPLPAGFSNLWAALLILGAGSIPGIVCAVWASRRGFTPPLAWLRCLVLGAALGLQGICLWFTFSRGAMLALTLAAALTIAMLYFAGFIRDRILPRLDRLPGMRLILAGLLLVAALAAWPLAGQLEGSAGTLSAQQSDNAPAALGPGAIPRKPSAEVTVEGENLGLEHLRSPASFRVRLTYWRVGLSMFLDNMLSGVGLGNFGLLYPKYQYAGSYPVQESHNGYLQMFSETGLFGGALFGALWFAIVLYGARRTVTSPAIEDRPYSAALFAGLLAFLLHSGMDINFSHPTLIMFAMTAVALLYARGAENEEAVTPPPAARWLAIALLVCIGLSVGSSARLYLFDIGLNRGRFMNMAEWMKKELAPRFEVGRFFLEDVWRYKWDPQRPKPQIRVGDVRMLLRDTNTIWRMGTLYVPAGVNLKGYRPLEVNERVPDEAVLVIDAKTVTFARNAMVPPMTAWVENLSRIDARYPYSPELAAHLSEWHTLWAERLAGNAFDEDRRVYADRGVEWARRAVERSPSNKDLYVLLGGAIWLRSWLQPEPADWIAGFREAVQAYQTAAGLAPIIAHYKDLLGKVTIGLGEAMIAQEQDEEGRQLVERGNALREEARLFQLELNKRGL
ncbi:MAG: O-antigen ligase family protein [Candidatus Hydrogenedentes bacterium]|nr:O-antigen ligase family protein [Candidatus Hydrogenedentota bacterium]